MGGRNPCTDRDHPRSRGVYGPRTGARAAGWGSSPLARGLPSSVRRQSTVPGIIPARAGFTHCGRHGRNRPRDHPRSRGVYVSTTACDRLHDGIIPARAGFTPGSARPHVVRRGSSPLARGLRVDQARGDAGGRIIPARAGFTGVGHGVLLDAGDHPRSRGVYLGARQHRLPPQGIIPARAGFTQGDGRHQERRRDHPRSRGVYVLIGRFTADGRGSSPLARGLPLLPPLQGGRAGIIPARAGFTCPLLTERHSFRDHPRSRGVYTSPGRENRRGSGSSPLARGLH